MDSTQTNNIRTQQTTFNLKLSHQRQKRLNIRNTTGVPKTHCQEDLHNNLHH